MTKRCDQDLQLHSGCISNTEQFKRHLKTLLFKSTFTDCRHFKDILKTILCATPICKPIGLPLLFWFSCKCPLLLLLLNIIIKWVTNASSFIKFLVVYISSANNHENVC